MSGTSWVQVPEGCAFGPNNLPYGVFSVGDGPARVGVAIGEYVLDVAPVLGDEVFTAPSLNGFLALGRAAWSATRARLIELLTDESARPEVEPHLIPMAGVRHHLPFEVADYVDFYSSEHHAANVGRMFRPGGDPLTPNWRHLPIGYHGRAGTVVVSGTQIRRPHGQRRPDPGAAPEFRPTQRLDIEAEVGFVVGVGTELGTSVSTADLREHVFGAVLVNDWSARDIQSWEYVPLGPFLGKSFATSIGAWVVPLDALEHAWVEPPARDPEPLPYLHEDSPGGLDIAIEVELGGEVISRPPFGQMYWTPAQQLAHMTVNGASLRTGDLYASGTVSGPAREERGCFLELSWNGEQPVPLADGSERTFLHDGDTVRITASAPGPGGERIGFGEVTGTVLAAG